LAPHRDAHQCGCIAEAARLNLLIDEVLRFLVEIDGHQSRF
jgi:hypothetical protein